MSAKSVALAHARRRARLANRLRREARQAWARVDTARISESWSALMPRLLAALTAAQHAAAASADAYVAAQAEGGAVSLIDPNAFAGVASDGRDLASLMAMPAIITLSAIGTGQTVNRAMAAGGALVQLAAHTQVTDAGRTADQVGMVANGRDGYTRMVVGKTCSRCIILAGRWYRWNAGFDRHPKCDCVGIPAAEDRADELTTDPRKVFDSMDAAEQDKVFTKAGAQSIRDGADMNQVVNARRGAAGLTPAGARITAEEARLLRGGRDVGRLQAQRIFGQDLFVTTEGTTTRGAAGIRLGAKESGVKVEGLRNLRARAPRLMPESIYKIAGDDRDEAIRLLRRFGYLR